MLKSILIAAIFLVPNIAASQAKEFTLSSPVALEDNGFLRFLLPRFTLKMRIRPEVSFSDGSAHARLNTETGIPVMKRLGQTYFISLDLLDTVETENAQVFADWLVSDIGKRTIEQFMVDGEIVFMPIAATAETVVDIQFYGDAVLGEALAFTHCARCHVINDKNRMNGIGSTPSFGALRSLTDWAERFQTFHVRIPHPSIIQIDGVSEPFSPTSPPANLPVYLTVDEVEDILTYVTTIAPVDLGAPLIQN
ncbi:MAG: hypothetical protein JKY41_07560 [Rhodobacteraceae bacterium]|nr:hypothetical protein [Paracoccaceae bacterium]